MHTQLVLNFSAASAFSARDALALLRAPRHASRPPGTLRLDNAPAPRQLQRMRLPLSLPRGLAAALSAPLLAACGGDGGESKSIAQKAREAQFQETCGDGDARTMQLAVGAYVTEADPKPTRFLNAEGTDSALPPAGVSALQAKGPTYLFPGRAELQAQVRAQMKERGEYTTMLVVPRGSEVAETRARVTLRGHYVGGEEEGRSSPERTFRFACDSTSGWKLLTGAGA